MRKVLLALVFLAAITSAFSQRPVHAFRERPDGQTVRRPDLGVAPGAFAGLKSIPEPPPHPVRTMAEWEEVEALVVTWAGYYDILTEIIRHSVSEARVIVITDNPAVVTQRMINEGIPLDNIELLNVPFNRIWIRDYGPWSVYYNDVDSLAIVDYIYNRPTRPLDDVIPEAVAEYLGLPFFSATSPPYDWIHAGGNNLRDGMGTTFSSELTLGENLYKHEHQIDEISQLYFGTDRYVKFPILPYDGIHHADMHMRIIDEETFLVGQYPAGVADGPQIEANIDYLKTHYRTPFGNIYNIQRLQMPPDFFGRYPDESGDYRTYTNAIFVNKTILVPTYEEQYDTTALRIYEEQLPGYNVVGIDCNDIITALGALHCITKLVGVSEPLLIAHPRLRDTYQTSVAFPVMARIKHRSGIAGATLFYRTAADEPYTSVSMTLEDAETATWSAAIPAQPAGTEVQYYIQATANSGKVQVRPLVAPEGYFRFRVKTAELPPVASFIYSENDVTIDQPVQFVDESTEAATWSWSFPGGMPATSTEAHPVVQYPTAGVYDVILIAGNALGSDTLHLTGAVTVGEGIEPFFDDFTGGPDAAWTIDDYNSDGVSWNTSSPTSCYGTALIFDNYVNDSRNYRDFLRARFDLRDLSEVMLHFDVAYGPYDDQYFDALRVNVLNAAGEKEIVYSKAGTDLATVPATGNTLFVPADCEQWRHEVIDLSDYDGQIITLEFESAGGWGNRLYLDNIDFSSPDLANLAPVVFIQSPANGTIFQDELPTVTILAAAGDIDGLVTGVDFYVNGEWYATDEQAPYSVDFTLPDYGDYTFIAEALDNDGALAQSSPVTVSAEETVSTENTLGSPLRLRVFPNPATDHLRVGYYAPETGPLQCRLTDLLGRTVLQETWSGAAGEQMQSLEIAQLPSGIYYLNLEQSGLRATRRVVVSHGS